jgi:hypothetical protein
MNPMYSGLSSWGKAERQNFIFLDVDRVNARRNCGDQGSSRDEPGIYYHSLVVQSDSVSA